MDIGCVTFCGEIRFKERKNGYIQKVTVAVSNFRVGKNGRQFRRTICDFPRKDFREEIQKKKCRKATIRNGDEK